MSNTNSEHPNHAAPPLDVSHSFSYFQISSSILISTNLFSLLNLLSSKCLSALLSRLLYVSMLDNNLSFIQFTYLCCVLG
jgi:hypothetical protein